MIVALQALRLGLFSTLIAGATSVAGAHDILGLVSQANLPEEVASKLKKLDEARQRTRLSGQALRQSVIDLLTKDQSSQTEGLRQLGLPTNLETALEQVFIYDTRWDKGAVITLCFMDGSQSARQNVIEAAREIFELAELTLDAGTLGNLRTCDLLTPSLIRVAFNTDGHWSYIGDDALLIPQSLPTLGLENYHLFSTLSDTQKGVVKHEFLHAVGAGHEHQHSQSNCEGQFNWPVIYTSIPWPKEQVDFNMRPLTTIPEFQNATIIETPYDRTSNMHYDLPAHFFLDPQSATCFVSENNVLSDGDRQMVQQMYAE